MPCGPILCVDDEPHNLALLREILKGEYPLVFARSGEDALRAVDKHHPCLILLDIQMPGMDGYTVCRRLKNQPATVDIPVIFITALSATDSEQAGFDAGGVDYITKPISPPTVKARVRTHLSLVRSAKLEQSYRDAIFMLCKVSEYNDVDTGLHIWRMAEYCRVLAAALGWPAERCDLLGLAASMHDIGKIGIPHEILKKPGKLDTREFAVMKTHSRIGHDILRRNDAPLFQLAADIALHHHEHWDGSGYPEGLAGDRIPEAARIATIADIFDALSMKRPYKEAWPLEQIIPFMHDGSGRLFDPHILTLFMDRLPQILELKQQWFAREQAAIPVIA